MMVRRDQLPRGIAWSHSETSQPFYIALGLEDYERVDKQHNTSKVWSVGLFPGIRSHYPASSLVWCGAEASCFAHPPDTWSPDTWSRVNDTVKQMARVGVLLTPMCGLLYR